MNPPCQQILENIYKELTKSEEISGRRKKFLYFQLKDSYRLGLVARDIAVRGAKEDNFTSEAVELILRRIIEHAILCFYIQQNTANEVIDRFFKTSASAWESSWQDTSNTEGKQLNVKQLPDYKQMSTPGGEDLYAVYQKLSYISHPRHNQPYSLIELEYCNKNSISAKDFYIKRVNDSLSTLRQVLEKILEIYQSE